MRWLSQELLQRSKETLPLLILSQWLGSLFFLCYACLISLSLHATFLPQRRLLRMMTSDFPPQNAFSFVPSHFCLSSYSWLFSLSLLEIWSLPCVGPVYALSLMWPHASRDQSLNAPGSFPAWPWPTGHQKQQEGRHISAVQKDLAGTFVMKVIRGQSLLQQSPKRCQDSFPIKVSGA